MVRSPRFAFLDATTPQAMAHRGGNVGPENTLAAFAEAVSLGYAYLETDVRLTADGHLVAFHDDDLSRVAGVPLTISASTLAEVQAVDLGGGERVPLMAELFDAFPSARFTIDPKVDEAVKPLMALIEATGSIGRVCIGSFSEERTVEARATLGPELCTSPASKGILKVLLAAFLRPGWRTPYGCVQLPLKAKGIRFDRPALIARIQRLDLQVHFWTINDRETIERLLDAGADVIITDAIETARQVLIDRDQWNPPTLR